MEHRTGSGPSWPNLKDLQSHGVPGPTHRLALFSFFRRRSLMLTRRRYWLSLIMSRTLL